MPTLDDPAPALWPAHLQPGAFRWVRSSTFHDPDGRGAVYAPGSTGACPSPSTPPGGDDAPTGYDGSVFGVGDHSRRTCRMCSVIAVRAPATSPASIRSSSR